jgi:glucose/mannose-6-phosphate isomerase
VTELDDLNELAELDSEEVLTTVERFADQCQEGWEIGRGAESLPDATGIDAVVVLGIGGSGLSGDVVQAVVEPRLAMPLRTFRGYGPLPEWMGRNTLVFAVSYSGNTEETVGATEAALERGCRIVTLSAGGALAELAADHGLAHVRVPPGLQPRASLGFLAFPLLAMLVKIGIVPDLQDDVDETIAVLSDVAERCHRKRPADDNPAKALALGLRGKIPVVYGGHGIGAVAAHRFKCDLNEYGKSPAFFNVAPELDHNEIVGWRLLTELTAPHFVNIAIVDPLEDERLALRHSIRRRLIEKALPEYREVVAEGTSPLARVFSLILMTQLAAIYLAFAYDVDPGRVQVISEMKERLAES